MLGERAREIEAADTRLLDEDLADPGAGLPLGGKRGLELRLRDEPELDEDLADRPPNPHTGLRRWRRVCAPKQGRNDVEGGPLRLPLLGKRAREVESAETSLLDEDLADAGAGLPLPVERSIELRAGDEPELDEDLADRPSEPHTGLRQRLRGSGHRTEIGIGDSTAPRRSRNRLPGRQ